MLHRLKYLKFNELILFIKWTGEDPGIFEKGIGGEWGKRSRGEWERRIKREVLPLFLAPDTCFPYFMLHQNYQANSVRLIIKFLNVFLIFIVF